MNNGNDTKTNFPHALQVRCTDGKVGIVLQTFIHSSDPRADLVQVELACSRGPVATWRVCGISPKFLTPFIGPLPG